MCGDICPTVEFPKVLFSKHGHEVRILSLLIIRRGEVQEGDGKEENE